jgi:uncharacterized protein YbaR (Trm112 family)
MDEFLLKILVCPSSRQSLTLADASLVKSINDAIETRSLNDEGGGSVEEQVEALLVREDGLVAYPIRNDIPEMLVQRGINLSAIT